MPYEVRIRRKADGVEQRYRVDDEWDDEVDEYVWSEGNNSCDCNRWLLYERAAGRTPDLEAAVCGTGAFAVTVILSDGTEMTFEERAEA